MTDRIPLSRRTPSAFKMLAGLHAEIEKIGVDAGLDKKILRLVEIRASQINGCAFCIDRHSKEARQLGETERRLYLLPAWRETDLYSEQERAALALTEEITRISETQDVSDEVYELATKVFTEQQYRAVAWSATVINAFNRLGVASHLKLPESA